MSVIHIARDNLLKYIFKIFKNILITLIMYVCMYAL